MNKKQKGSKILCSACLYGFCCKYDGGTNTLKDPLFQFLKNSGRLVPVCPEELGGLSTPRIPAEQKDGKVINKEGEDVTAQFELGAQKALEIARKNGVRVAIMKQGSPSCGCKRIYDGTFTGTKITGEGVTVRKLIENGIPVFDETEVSFAKLLADGDPHNHHHE